MALGYDLIDFENDSHIDFFKGEFGDYGRDDTYHHGEGEWSLRLKDAKYKHPSGTYANIIGASGEIQFMYKTYPTYQDYCLNFSLDGKENISIIPKSGWINSGPIPINLLDNSPHKVYWEYKQNGPSRSSSQSSAWMDDIQLLGNLKFILPNGSNNSNMGFRNDSFSPRKGPLLSPFHFEIVVDGLELDNRLLPIELEIRNSSNNEIEIQKTKILGPGQKIEFEDIRFVTPGKKKYKYILGRYTSKEYTSKEFDGPEISSLIINITPSEGSNQDSYKYEIERNSFENISNIFLDIKYKNSFNWQYCIKGEWSRENVTFEIPELSSDDPCLGNIQYRFRTDYGIIGPFQGPYIFINYRNINQDLSRDFLSIDVKSDRCPERICLFIGRNKYEKIYRNCNNWETLEWKNLGLRNVNNFDIGSCDCK